MEEAREIGARGDRVRGRDDHAKRKKCEAEDWNLDEVWGENERSVAFGEFEDRGEIIC